MKVYIAGKITGTPKDICFNKFLAQENVLKDQGYDVINPLRLHGINSIEDYHSHVPKPWQQYLKIDIAQLMECEAACFLPCWKDSKGARLEHEVAIGLGIEIEYL